MAPIAPPPQTYYPASQANREIDDLRKRNAALENALEFVGRQVCAYRARGECLLDCQGAMVCDLTGLKLVPGEKSHVQS